MTRIAVGAFLHETNTFAPTKATYDAFMHWPTMVRGGDAPKVKHTVNVGLAGFVERAEANDWEIVSTVAFSASPSAHVTQDAFALIGKGIIGGIAAAGPLDAV